MDEGNRENGENRLLFRFPIENKILTFVIINVTRCVKRCFVGDFVSNQILMSHKDELVQFLANICKEHGAVFKAYPYNTTWLTREQSLEIRRAVENLGIQT